MRKNGGWATSSGWWFERHPSEKYEFVNDGMMTATQDEWENKIDGNQTTNQSCKCWFTGAVSRLYVKLTARRRDPQNITELVCYKF